MNTPKLPPLPHWCEPGSPFAEQMQAYAIAAIHAQASVEQQEHLASAQVVSMNDMQGVVDWLPHQGQPIKVGDYLYTHPVQQASAQQPDGSALQMEAAVIQAQKVLSDWNEWYGLNGGNAPLPPSGIVKAQEMLAEVRSLLASAPPAPQAKPQPLTDDEIRRIELTVHGYTRQPLDVKAFARAIEAAACAERDQRIAELEANEKVLLAQVQGHTQWREKIIKASEQAYGESAIRYKFSLTKNGKCMNTFPKEIAGRWFALVPAEDDGHIGHIARIAELERQLEEARKDAELYRWLTGDHPGQETRNQVEQIAYGIRIRTKSYTDAVIDAAMQKGQS